jgi:hypothetical protein
MNAGQVVQVFQKKIVVAALPGQPPVAGGVQGGEEGCHGGVR